MLCSALATWTLECVDVGKYPRYVLKHGLEHTLKCNHPSREALEGNGEYLKERRLVMLEECGASGFYFGTLGRADTESKLRGAPPGTFLIRFSLHADTFCVSVAVGDGRFAHYLLYADVPGPDGTVGYCINHEWSDPSLPLYSSLGDFVSDYQRKGILTDWVRDTPLSSATGTAHPGK